jgi:hypothetical protein
VPVPLLKGEGEGIEKKAATLLKGRHQIVSTSLEHCLCLFNCYLSISQGSQSNHRLFTRLIWSRLWKISTIRKHHKRKLLPCRHMHLANKPIRDAVNLVCGILANALAKVG